MQLWRVLLWQTLMFMPACYESAPPAFGCEDEQCGPCMQAEDCPQAPEARFECLANTCVQVDECSAGIYVADELPPRVDANGDAPAGTVVRQITGVADDVSVADGELRINSANSVRFEADVFDGAPGATDRPLFVEARLALSENSQVCSAVLYFYPKRDLLLRLCLGGGRIGMAIRTGGATSLVADEHLDLTNMHTYLLEYEPIPAQPGPVVLAPYVISLSIDGVVVLDRQAIETKFEVLSDHAPLIGFGTWLPGDVTFDFVRWGCDAGRGPCRPDLQDDDEDCVTGRQGIGECDGDQIDAERCDGVDNDCDGEIDELFRRDSPYQQPTGFNSDIGQVYLGEGCGMAGGCGVVVCAEDGRSLTCDPDAPAAICE